jgi:hypothetical protein
LEVEEVELVVLIQYFQQSHLQVVVKQEHLQLVLVQLEVQVVVR